MRIRCSAKQTIKALIGTTFHHHLSLLVIVNMWTLYLLMKNKLNWIELYFNIWIKLFIMCWCNEIFHEALFYCKFLCSWCYLTIFLKWQSLKVSQKKVTFLKFSFQMLIMDALTKNFNHINPISTGPLEDPVSTGGVILTPLLTSKLQMLQTWNFHHN